jgi:PelA/Pel-15E family pectate lyase
MFRRFSSALTLTTPLVVAFLLSGCSGPSPTIDGAGGGLASGGTVSASGGSLSGGQAVTNGGSAPGGTSAAGGNAETGGASIGGASAAGGNAASGGANTFGGAATGSAVAVGGNATGGMGTVGGAATGGKATTGGAPIVGGSLATGGAVNAGGSSATGGSAAVTLSQTGNPVNGLVSTYTGWLSTASGDAAKLTADETIADNMITWQMPHGGWFKYGLAKYAAAWNGTEARADWTGANGVELGTIDNNGTVTEIMFQADVYRRSNVTKYRDSARKGLDFLLTMQYASGGFPQVYPARSGTSYSNYVTFNDDAMVRLLTMLDRAAKQQAPFTATTFSSDQLAKLPSAIAKGIDYILKAQIVQSGVKTVWCAQHDPTSYTPLGARSYELPSKSGSESVGVIGFLLSQPQTTDVKTAAQAAIAWYKSATAKVADTAYVSRPSTSTDDTYNPIQAKAGSTMWYRFYDLAQDVGFFSGRLPTDNPPGVGKKYDIMEIEAERRYGYQWGGAYGTKLFAYTDTVGY